VRSSFVVSGKKAQLLSFLLRLVRVHRPNAFSTPAALTVVRLNFPLPWHKPPAALALGELNARRAVRRPHRGSAMATHLYISVGLFKAVDIHPLLFFMNVSRR
jgi:hypothetical protein